MPEMLKPAPVTLTEEMVKLAEPPFEMVMVCELLVPVETLPKAALDGVAEICGCVPVPVIEMVSGEFGALLTMEMVPVSVAAGGWSELRGEGSALASRELERRGESGDGEAGARGGGLRNSQQAEPPLVKVTV